MSSTADQHQPPRNAPPEWSPGTHQLIELACAEDLGNAGDITCALWPGARGAVTARLVTRQAGVISGLALGPAICTVFSNRLNVPLTFTPAKQTGGGVVQDGERVTPGTCVATVSGPWAGVLAVERTLLNFLGRMSGVATLTDQYVRIARQANPAVQLTDTRKTMPGWRELDKYAVRSAGGTSHRIGLYDAILIKDNHLADVATTDLARVLTERLEEAPQPGQFIEVETDTFDQFVEICRVSAVDIVLLDNFTPADLAQAVSYRDSLGPGRHPLLEASGGITLETLAEVAHTGVDRISVGALTHSAVGLDLGLDF